MGLPVLRLVPYACMPSPLPRQVQWKLVRSYIPIVIGLPRNSGGSAPASPFSRPARRLQRYGLQTCRVALATLYTGGFSSFVASTAAPIATGWNEPVPGWGFHPLWTNAFSRRTEPRKLSEKFVSRLRCWNDLYVYPVLAHRAKFCPAPGSSLRLNWRNRAHMQDRHVAHPLTQWRKEGFPASRISLAMTELLGIGALN
jgi:hypothetical protein